LNAEGSSPDRRAGEQEDDRGAASSRHKGPVLKSPFLEQLTSHRRVHCLAPREFFAARWGFVPSSAGCRTLHILWNTLSWLLKQALFCAWEINRRKPRGGEWVFACDVLRLEINRRKPKGLKS
jgi:hypothetical protein